MPGGKHVGDTWRRYSDGDIAFMKEKRDLGWLWREIAPLFGQEPLRLNQAFVKRQGRVTRPQSITENAKGVREHKDRWRKYLGEDLYRAYVRMTTVGISAPVARQIILRVLDAPPLSHKRKSRCREVVLT